MVILLLLLLLIVIVVALEVVVVVGVRLLPKLLFFDLLFPIEACRCRTLLIIGFRMFYPNR